MNLDKIILDEIKEATKELGRRYYPKEAVIHALLTKTSLLYNLEQLVYFNVDETNNSLIAIQGLGSLTEEDHNRIIRDVSYKSFTDLVKVYSPKLDEEFNRFIFSYEIPLDKDSIMARAVKNKLSFEGGIIKDSTDVDRELFDKFGTDKFIALTIKGMKGLENEEEQVIGIIYGNMKFSRQMPVVDKTLLNAYRYIFSPIIQLIEKYEKAIKNESLSKIGQFTSEIVHSLRPSVAAIGLAANIISKEIDKGELDYNSLKEKNNIILEEASKLEKYISGIKILSWTKKEIPFEKIDLIEIINDSLKYSKNLNYKINNIANNSFIYGNYGELNEAVSNIFNNCFEAMEEDKNPIKKENILTIDIYNDKDLIYLQTNNRQFIPFNIQKRLYDIGFTTKENGTGLGLSITKKIIQHHNGNLNVKSDEIEGTTFTVKLPLYKG